MCSLNQISTWKNVVININICTRGAKDVCMIVRKRAGKEKEKHWRRYRNEKRNCKRSRLTSFAFPLFCRKKQNPNSSSALLLPSLFPLLLLRQFFHSYQGNISWFFFSSSLFRHSFYLSLSLLLYFPFQIHSTIALSNLSRKHEIVKLQNFFSVVLSVQNELFCKEFFTRSPKFTSYGMTVKEIRSKKEWYKRVKKKSKKNKEQNTRTLFPFLFHS